MTLAQTAFNNTQVREIRAESFYYYGRAYHAQNQLDQAFKASDCLWQYANELHSFAVLFQCRGIMARACACTVRTRPALRTKRYSLSLSLYFFSFLSVGITSNGKIGDYEKAIACFDAVLKKHPDNYETLKVSCLCGGERTCSRVANLS